MNLDNITTQPFILSLFKRDDGVRFLLGSGAYEFKNSQLHFVANAFMNDVVEVQGNDGALLAGQVRRAKVQPFDGYVGDGSTIKSKVEQYRTNFMKFFQKNHFYTVIYIFPDGTAIQRRRGYIVDAPEVKELYQTAPEYHIAFNFEDVNYYKYSENDEGEETYSNLAEILSSITVAGGLVWDNAGSTTETKTKTGTNITLDYSTDDGFDDVEIYGDTKQDTYSGKNLFNPSIVVSGYGLNYPDGTTYSSASRSYLNYTKIEGGQNYAISGLTVKVVIFYSSQDESTSLGGTNNLPASGVITAPASANYVRIAFDNTVDYSKPQLEKSSVITSYEPYVGGTASPNPDYPQEVQTVTGEQTITVSDGDSQTQTLTLNLGKNLANYNTSGINNFNIGDIEAGKTYTISFDLLGSITGDGGLALKYGSSGTSIYTWWQPVAGHKKYTFTATTSAILYYNAWGAGSSAGADNIMLEEGSEESPYVPYFTPIELCKIGTYQDYIYKSGGDWYIHKETAKIVLDGNETISKPFTNVFVVENLSGDWVKGLASVFYYCKNYYPLDAAASNSAFNTLATNYSYAFDFTNDSLGKNIRIKDTRYDNANNYKAWLASNSVIIYYALATATDTQITDATLISQLEALLGADTYTGGTNVVISGNLAGTLSITYTAEIVSGGGVEWDNYGAVWEDGGGGGQTIISVDSITNVLPTIKITGPATNPILTNITTGQAIKYYGNVLASQTLVIDVNEKTAKLNGTSVIQNVDGDWLQLAPGNNRMEYTVDNAEQVSATIEWQEIVG